jgi:hypothetical protein
MNGASNAEPFSLCNAEVNRGGASMRKQVHRFEIYRYQILPVDRYFQGELFGNIQSIEELIEVKNEVFQEAINGLKAVSTKKTEIIVRRLGAAGSLSIFRLGANRSIVRETEEFTEEELDNWPSFLIGVWNDPEKQLLIIEERREAFQHTSAVANAFENALSRRLASKQLAVYVEPLFKEEEFWKIAERYRGKITDVKFELITPNMSNISDALSEDLKDLAKSSNTAKTNLQIKAPDDSVLNLEGADRAVRDLVAYSSEGGGNISVKAKGVARRIQTAETKEHIEIDELEIQAHSAEEIAETMKALLE